MIWSTLSGTLLSVFTTIALEPADVPSAPAWVARWTNQSRPFVDPRVQVEVLLRITTVKQTFQEKRDVATTGGLTRTIHGMRDFVLNIQVRSYRQDAPHWALEYAERCTTRLDQEAIADTLRAANCFVVELGPIQDLDKVVLDNRVASVASLDVHMRAGFADSAQAIGWIASIELTSNLKISDGSIRSETFLVPET